jgi:AcrR family transcriptional regulator
MMASITDQETRIISVAMRHLDEFGEKNFRLRQVADEVGIRESTLFYYFKNREHLIVVAHTERFKKSLITTIDPFIEAVQTCESQEAFVQIVKNVLIHSFDESRKEVRLIRSELIGNTRHRVVLHEALRDAIDSALIDAIDSLNIAKCNGWLRESVDPRTLAVFMLSLISSFVIPEVVDDRNLSAEWEKMAIQAITAIISSN